jgi:hypothetical protein
MGGRNELDTKNWLEIRSIYFCVWSLKNLSVWVFLCNTAVGDTGPTFWVTAEQQTGDDLLAAAQCSVVMAMN